jgi:hypothetical protein
MYRDAEDENAFLLLQEWDAQSTLDLYIRSGHFRTILAVMEMTSAPPEPCGEPAWNRRGGTELRRLGAQSRSSS